jgi:hypothetical protein
MPAAIGIEAEEEMISSMFEGSSSSVVLGDKEAQMCAEYVKLNEAIKKMEAQKTALATNLKATLLENADGNGEKKISAVAGNFSVSWSRFDTTRVDTEALKKPDFLTNTQKQPNPADSVLPQRKGHDLRFNSLKQVASLLPPRPYSYRLKHKEKTMLLKRIEIRNVRKLKQADIDFHGAGLQVFKA